jgi:hypothetical protein
VACLDSSLRRAKKTVDLLSSRAVYIVLRFHQIYREKLERHVAGENQDLGESFSDVVEQQMASQNQNHVEASISDLCHGARAFDF